MARVPLQQTPTEQFDTGGNQFFTGGGNVTPVQDVVSDDLKRVSTSMKQVAQIATQLQNEYNDAEAKKLENEYDSEVQEIENEYLNLEGANAVATTKTGDGVETESTYDQYIKRINELLENKADQASNGQIRSMFETMASVTAKSAKNRMTNHSIRQQRKFLENEQKAFIKNLQNKSIYSFESWANPEGNFQKFYTAGLIEIIKRNKLKNRITEGPNASQQYIQEVNEYNKKIAEGVMDNLAKINQHNQLEKFLQSVEPFLDPTTLQKLVDINKKRHTEFATTLKVDAVINDNTNQNNNNIVNKAHKLFSLQSNNTIDDGLGGFVENGFNSNDALLDITGKPITEQIDALEKLRNTSIFYDPEKATRLIPQHEIIHLFAIQKIGVKKADSLYKKAKSNAEMDTAKYKEDATYAKEINKKIIDNYNNLIKEETNKIYARFGESDYAVAIANDLEILKKGINYDENIQTKTDFITQLTSLNDKKQQIKETIANKEEQEAAIKELEEKYNKIKIAKETQYNTLLNTAKEIAFAEAGGWKNLEANGIKIENFSESDQEILKKGQPEESDLDTLIELEKNPVEVATNLPAYSQLLSQSDYLGLKNYANSLRSESSTGSATADSTMFDDTLITYGFDTIFTKKKGKGTENNTGETDLDKKKDYIQLKAEWKERINQYIADNNGAKPTNAEKQNMLNEILNDKVYVKTPWFKQHIQIPAEALDDDQFKDAFVFVGSEKVFTYNIPKDVREYFISGYVAAGMSYTEQMIANEWILHGKKKSKSEIIKYVEDNNL